MLNLEDEKKRLAELEAEYECKKNEYGGQMILGQVIELRRIIYLLEDEMLRCSSNDDEY